MHLINREKGQKLTFEQKKLIKDIIKYRTKLYKVKSLFSASDSALKGIFWMFEKGHLPARSSRNKVVWRPFYRQIKLLLEEAKDKSYANDG